MNREDRVYIEVRCPFEQKSKRTQELYRCNALCTKTSPGSYGETRCRRCKRTFQYEIDDQARPTLGVRVQKIEDAVTNQIS